MPYRLVQMQTLTLESATRWMSFRGKGRSDQVNLIFTQLSIPSVTAQDIKQCTSMRRDSRWITRTDSPLRWVRISCPSLPKMSPQRITWAHRSRTGRLQRERAKVRTNPKTTLRLLFQMVWPSILRFSSLRIRISSRRFRYIHPNSTGKIRSTGISCRPISEITTRFAALTSLTPSTTSTMERSDTLPRKVRIRPTRESWTFRFSGQTRIAEAETAACLNTSIHSSSIRIRSWYNGTRTTCTHPLDSKDGSSDRWWPWGTEIPFKQERRSLSLLQTAREVAQPMSLRKQGLFIRKQLQIRALQTRNRIRRKIAPHLGSRISPWSRSIDQGLSRSPPSGQQHQSQPANAEHSDPMQTRWEVAEHESDSSAGNTTGPGCDTRYTSRCTLQSESGRSAIDTHTNAPESGSPWKRGSAHTSVREQCDDVPWRIAT